MVSASVRRQQIAYVCQRGRSVRRACALLSVARSSAKYESKLAQRDAPAVELTNHSLPEIGDAFGGRDHTTVLHACRRIKENGPEFVSRAVLKWLTAANIDTAHIDPGKPWQNGTNESSTVNSVTNASPWSGSETELMRRSRSSNSGVSTTTSALIRVSDRSHRQSSNSN